jgi:6-phosphogluconolactonase
MRTIFAMALACAGCGTTHDLADAAGAADANGADGALAIDAGSTDAPVSGHPHVYVYYSGAEGIAGASLDTVTGGLTALPGIWPVQTSDYYLNAIAISPDGKYLYAAASRGGTLMQYAIDHSTGALTHVADTVIAGGAQYVAIDPKGRALYVTEPKANALGTFTIDPSTGEASAAGTIDVVTAPYGIAVDPQARTLAVAGGSGTSWSISMCTLDATTAMPTKQGDVAAGNGAFYVAYDASGTRLYASANNDGKLDLFDVVPATAAATERTPVTSGHAPMGMAIAPGGTHGYVADYHDGVVPLAIAADGTPSVAGAPVVLYFPYAVGIDPNGAWAVASGSNLKTLESYAIDPSTGALTHRASFTANVDLGYVIAFVRP